MIKNIVFDLGGVVLTVDDNWLFSKETKKLLKADDGDLSKAWNFAWPDARSGKINEDEFFKRFLQNLTGSFSSDLVLKLKKIYRKQAGELGVIELLPGLKSNYKTFVFTNVAKDWLRYKIDRFNLKRYFNLIISSCNEGIAKPSKEIFLSLIKKGQINPKESVFIDDMEKNIKPAQEFGFKTILFKNKEQMIKEMENLGIKI